jgi:hypothetical protein
MMSGHCVLVVGTGRFAAGLCRSLSRAARHPLRAWILGRTTDRARRLAGETGHVQFRPIAAQLGLDGRPDEVARVLARTRPDLVVVCASHQSPDEIRAGRDAWAVLLREAGFFATVALQAALADGVAAACASARIPVLNACFPDAVNPLLAARGHGVLGGLGNVASLADAAAENLGLAPGSDRLHMLAHHAHLHPPPRRADEARCWVDGRPVPDVGALLTAARGGPRLALNERGAAAAGALVAAMLRQEPVTTHMPGPLGLPGGYPVRVTGSAIDLRLPPHCDLDGASRWNRRVASLDGGRIEPDGAIHFGSRAVAALRRHLPDLPDRVAPADLFQLTETQLAIRHRLRGG